MTEILCSGNDLDRVCDEVEAKGGTIEAVDAGYKGKPAQYRLEVVFNGRVADLVPPLAGRQRSAGSNSPEGNNPSAPDPLKAPAKPLRLPVAPLETPCPSCGGPVPENGSCAICMPLARLKTRLEERKRLRRPKMVTEARVPYKD